MVKAKNKIPALRFPEFEGEWKITTLGQIAGNFSYGLNAASKDYDGENKYIRITDIDENLNIFKPNPLTSPEGDINNNYLLKEGDIVFARTGASVGKTYLYNNKDGKLYYAGFLIKASIENANPYFIFLQTLRKNYRKWVKIISMRSGQPGINAEEYKTLIINLPSDVSEQQKIAAFFTAIDKRITLLTQKKEKAEQYKKGVMQKIFSRQLRFKDDNGNDFPEWEMKKFGELYSFKVTNSYSRDKLNYEHGIVKNIHYGDIHTKFNALFDIEKENVPYINQDINLSKIPEECYIKEGDLVLADASEDYADIGKSIEVVNLNNEKVVSGLHTILARKESDKMQKGYASFLLQSSKIRKDMMQIAQGTKILGISSKKVANITLPLPSLKEQQKIAAFLTAIDHKIETTDRQINAMKTWKQGLLQKMFV